MKSNPKCPLCKNVSLDFRKYNYYDLEPILNCDSNYWKIKDTRKVILCPTCSTDTISIFYSDWVGSSRKRYIDSIDLLYNNILMSLCLSTGLCIIDGEYEEEFYYDVSELTLESFKNLLLDRILFE